MQYDQSFPCLVTAWIFIGLLPFSLIISKIVKFVMPGVFEIILNIDENLPNYYEALDQIDKQSMVLDEENMRANYVRIALFLNAFSVGSKDLA